MTLEQLEAELHRVTEQKNAQYWAFCRQAKAPPVDPALCRRQVELELEIRRVKRAAASADA